MKFSLFKRSSSKGSTVPAPNQVTKRPVHPALPGAEELEVELVLGDGQGMLVDLYDMNIQGAEVRIPFHMAPQANENSAVDLKISHPEDCWTVRAKGVIRKVERWDDASVLLMVQFAALGDLYAQLDDALGRYFNRRSATRVHPHMDERVPVKIAYQSHRLRGLAQDVSRTGLGVMMPLVQAAVFKSGERVTVWFELPGVKGEFETPATVKHGYRQGEEVLLGIEFDLLADSPMRTRRSEFAQYIDERRAQMEAWQQGLSRSA